MVVPVATGTLHPLLPEKVMLVLVLVMVDMIWGSFFGRLNAIFDEGLIENLSQARVLGSKTLPSLQPFLRAFPSMQR